MYNTLLTDINYVNLIKNTITLFKEQCATDNIIYYQNGEKNK